MQSLVQEVALVELRLREIRIETRIQHKYLFFRTFKVTKFGSHTCPHRPFRGFCSFQTVRDLVQPRRIKKWRKCDRVVPMPQHELQPSDAHKQFHHCMTHTCTRVNTELQQLSFLPFISSSRSLYEILPHQNRSSHS